MEHYLTLTSSESFTIQFLDWDDTVITAYQLADGDVITIPEHPTRPDDDSYRYTFAGWKPTVPATATADGTYKATYTSVPCYTVEFHDYDGTVITSHRYVEGAVITVPNNPIREDDGAFEYRFAGWTPEVNRVAVANATYTATYTSTPLDKSYMITFKDWDGTMLSVSFYSAGDKVEFPPNPIRESDGVYTYEFKGWTPSPSSIACADVTYVAEYTVIEIPVYYDIVFVDWNGKIISSTSTLKNAEIVVPDDPVREFDGKYRHEFIGWTPTVKSTATADAKYTATYKSYRIYNSVSEILYSTEFESIRYNEKNDSSTDTITGADWFTYAGKKCTTIYVNGDSYIGLGTNSQDLKVNYRSGASWYVYRDEGTLYGYYKFLRIRFSGYSNYNYSTDAYKITYDVILWETGDISLHMIDIPTSYYTGVFALGSLSYTKPTTAYPDVTFRLQADGTYVASSTLISFTLDAKYLVKIYDGDNYTLYTVVGGALSALTTQEVSMATFVEYGCDEVPSSNLLSDCAHFELLKWCDGNSEYYHPNVKVAVTATPYPQTVESKDYDMSHSTIHGIEKVSVEATGTVSFAL